MRVLAGEQQVEQMRVLLPRLQAVLDPEASRPRRQPHSSAAPPGRSVETARPSVSGLAAAKDLEGDEYSPFDRLHTERGFTAFEQWYRRVLATGPAANVAPAPRPEFSLLWPQVYCPPNALHEHAFMELLRAFADCTDSEAFDFFDLLDYDYHGMLGLPEVYFAMCLVAALGSRQLTKFIYFHSTRFFGILARGCRFSAAPDHITWARLLMLLRLLGTPGHLISKVCVESDLTPLAQMKYDDFLDVAFPVMVQLDRGADVGEITVINECDRTGNARSKMCTVL